MKIHWFHRYSKILLAVVLTIWSLKLVQLALIYENNDFAWIAGAGVLASGVWAALLCEREAQYLREQGESDGDDSTTDL